MSGREKILDDIARVAGGTVSIFGGFRGQMKEETRARIDELALRLDWVPRAEFERLEAMLAKARDEQESLTKRIDDLERQMKKG